MQLLEDRVMLKMVSPEATSPGGIVLPAGAQEKQQTGYVVHVGPGRLTPEGTLVPMTVKSGDQVLLAKYAGTEVEIGNKKMLVVRESDILLIL